MYTTFKRALAGLAIAGTLIWQTAAAADMPKELNIVYVKAPFNLQNMVLKEKGMLEKAFAPYGTKVRWHNIVSGAKQARAMAAGSPVLVADGVAHPTDTFAIVGPKGRALTVKDLKGKKVAGPRGTVLHQLLVAALKKEGLTMADVEFVSMDPAPALSALLSGNVDAALLAAGAVIKAEEAGCRTITTAKDLVNVNLVMTAAGGFAKKYPEALELVVKTHREALKWIDENEDEAIAIGAKEHGISLQDAETLAEWSHYYSILTDKDVDGLYRDQAFLIENGMMQKQVNIRELVLPTARR